MLEEKPEVDSFAKAVQSETELHLYANKEEKNAVLEEVQHGEGVKTREAHAGIDSTRKENIVNPQSGISCNELLKRAHPSSDYGFDTDMEEYMKGYYD